MKESIDKLVILAEKEDAYIGICRCCSTINFVYKNIAIKFKINEFDYYKNYMDKLHTDEFLYESRTGKNIFMRSPTNNIVFCYSKSEVEEIKLLLNEASLMLEVHQVLK